MEYLEQLKKKPSYVKTQVAFAGAGFVTLVIGVVWFSTLDARFDSLRVVTSSDIESTLSEETAGGDTFKDVYNNTKAGIGNALESIRNGDAQTPTDTPVTEERSNIVIPEALNNVSVGASALEALNIQESEKTVPDEELTGEAAVEQPSEPEAPTMPPAPPEPRVILIGTTTSQKSE